MTEKTFASTPAKREDRPLKYRRGEEWSKVQQSAQGGIRTQAVALKHADPLRTLQSIGDALGVSRERVRQLLKAEGLDKTYPVREYVSKRAGLHNSCNQCEIELMPNDYTGRRQALCKKCRLEVRHKANYTTVKCPHCAVTWDMRTKELQTRLDRKKAYATINNLVNATYQPFCSRKCTAQYHGWAPVSKLTPEIAMLCKQMLEADSTLIKIAEMVHETFDVSISPSTLSVWNRKGLLGGHSSGEHYLETIKTHIANEAIDIV